MGANINLVTKNNLSESYKSAVSRFRPNKKGNKMAAVYANSSNQIAALKELYTDDKDYMKDLVYKENK